MMPVAISGLFVCVHAGWWRPSVTAFPPLWIYLRARGHKLNRPDMHMKCCVELLLNFAILSDSAYFIQLVTFKLFFFVVDMCANNIFY